MKHYYTNVMKPLHSKIKKYKIASYDIETYEEIIDNRKYTKFLLGGYIDTKGKYKSFTNEKVMIKYIQEHDDNKTITFATNNMFDYQALFSNQSDYYDYNVLPRGSRIIISKYRGIQMYDTMNYVQYGVKELGKMLGLPKGDFDVTTTQPLKYYKTHKEEFRKLRIYNQRDCEITREFMIQFQDILNELGGELKSTIGSCALNLFRRKYQTQNWYKEYCIKFNDGELVKDFIFRGYRGGRTETFKRGDTNYKIAKNIKLHKKKPSYYYYDFNSMYADCMRGEFPLPSSARINENNYGELKIDNILKYRGMSECTIVSPYMKYPLLPTTINHKLCFPVGRIEKEVFTHGELQQFIKIGGKIEKVFKTLYYTKIFSPFKNWVNVLYGKRQQAQKNNNIVYDTIYKNILVNLYGKFGTHKLKNFELVNINTTNNLIGVQINEENNFNYRETPNEKDLSYVFPIIASEVTMKGRLKLYKKIIETDAIQCDTDSVFSEKKIKTSNKLGFMKLEDVIHTLVTIKPKWYSYYSTVKNKMVYKLKGIKLSSYDDLRDREFTDAINGKKVKQWKFVKMKESLRGVGKPNERIDFDKTMNIKDDKRVWKFPFSKYEFQDSNPIILGFKNDEELNEYFIS